MTETWSEDDSAVYQQLARVAVPARADQMATLLSLLPFDTDATFNAVELASGEGYFAEALLELFPNARLLALDGSAAMQAATATRLARFGERATVAPFDLESTDWLPRLDGVDVVYSSLCVHHLTPAGKQALFAAVAERLSPRGVFLLADIVIGKRAEASKVFAAHWDAITQAQAEAQGDLAAYELFQKTQWNIFHHPDPLDKPSPLADQLAWMQAAGLKAVDCFWLNAGHAVYGGYASETASSEGVAYDRALQAAQKALAT